MSAPSTLTEPAVGSSSPMIIAMVVVLPAPLPPSSAVMLPGASAKEMPETAGTFLYTLTRRSTATAGTDAEIMSSCVPRPAPPAQGSKSGVWSYKIAAPRHRRPPCPPSRSIRPTASSPPCCSAGPSSTDGGHGVLRCLGAAILYDQTPDL